MKRTILLALAALAIGGANPAAAAPAPFGCDAHAGQTCYFKIYYSPRSSIVQLPTGMKVSIPDVVVGRDQYCVDVGKPPAYKCTPKTINRATIIDFDAIRPLGEAGSVLRLPAGLLA
jgi:hypothetical protein